jgi:hypothetical protein
MLTLWFAVYVRWLTLHPIQLESKQHRCRTREKSGRRSRVSRALRFA